MNECVCYRAPVETGTKPSAVLNGARAGRLISLRRPAGKPSKRDRALKRRITPLPPFSEAHCDRLVRLERVHMHRVKLVEPKADIPIRAGVSVVVLAALVTDTQMIVRQAAPIAFGEEIEPVANWLAQYRNPVSASLFDERCCGDPCGEG